ncbi:collagen alpha-1(XI) chain [Elysia marginata]|uniref:Collagen alpha-1(XI) chain n=1 Tax=Elysia marginata TaxID=1093978 RepID=A0AAV4ELK4_9GAST|nr:collagen alpha-1(XI) chain [Elysia marginata]
MEGEIIGWDEWSSWSPCSAFCGEGRQYRSRDCPINRNSSKICVGVGQESRSCNVFSCQGSHDLLTLMGVRSLPQGVTKNNATNDAEYVIAKDAIVSMSASRVYDLTLPSEFSILMEVKVHRSKKRRYVFTVTDFDRKQQLAVFVGRRVKFQYLGNNYGFKVDILDNEWHTLSFAVDTQTVSLVVDCDTVFSRKLRTMGQYLGTNLLMSIGPYFPEYGKRFEGEIRQLVISDDTTVATQQCGSLLLNEGRETTQSTTTDAVMTTAVTSPSSTSVTSPHVYGLEWSAWSPCSVSCGQGRQSRQALCRANNVYGKSCDPYKPRRPETRGACLNVKMAESAFPSTDANVSQDFLAFAAKKKSAPWNVFTVEPAIPPPVAAIVPPFSQALHVTRPCVNLSAKMEDVVYCLDSVYVNPVIRDPAVKRYARERVLTEASVSLPIPARVRLATMESAAKKFTADLDARTGASVSRLVYACVGLDTMARTVKVTTSAEFNVLTEGRVMELILTDARVYRDILDVAVRKPEYLVRATERCSITCVNGGRCKHSNICRCPLGFSGRRCEKRSCSYQHYLVPHRRTYRRIVRIEEPVRCAAWSNQWCVRTRCVVVFGAEKVFSTMFLI